ncbi:N-formylglutamate amidohydrolase [Nocardia otitidiscaviarum]|uniref:N-formylglutamate amidohydrolase n=1 Tax=Nocardia otitidiscaviarum TaxID=1823 RepID=A0A516NMV9_9NOCA|nr:N-formylglutamate amidohydrolase [Nocardia otitidiscaviarum]MCP9624502.1 N-formylglutamate amidohydrolase [Nocardia otitidiscaviarum]QDP80242.1 N-formylglutamate amidohydrolase [Nocardia otitidiscaviarum]
MTQPRVILPGDPTSPVVLHVPHAGREIPPDVRAGIALSESALAAELAESTDTATDSIAATATERAARRPWRAVHRYSRLVVDPERFPDASEPMLRHGRGAVYERTCGGAALRTGTGPTADELLARYFHPYAAAVTALVSERLAATGAAAVVDVHSYPARPSAFENAARPRPPICVGTDATHTPPWLAEAARRVFEAAGAVEFDTPYAGCYVPLAHYRRDLRVAAVMIEIRRDLYLDAYGEPRPAAVADLGSMLAELADAATVYSLTSGSPTGTGQGERD